MEVVHGMSRGIVRKSLRRLYNEATEEERHRHIVELIILAVRVEVYF